MSRLGQLMTPSHIISEQATSWHTNISIYPTDIVIIHTPATHSFLLILINTFIWGHTIQVLGRAQHITRNLTASAPAVVRINLPPSAYALQLLEAPPTSHSHATPFGWLTLWPYIQTISCFAALWYKHLKWSLCLLICIMQCLVQKSD